MLTMTSVISRSVSFVVEFPQINSHEEITVHFLFASFFVVSAVATIEWIYLKARKAVTWTSDPNRWDTFAMIEISHRERTLRRELSAEETKAIIEKWFRRFMAVRLGGTSLSDHFKSGQRLSLQNRPTEWPSRTEIVLPCRLLWWQVGFGAPAPRTAFEHMAVVQ
jgi:hypothetical protein